MRNRSATDIIRDKVQKAEAPDPSTNGRMDALWGRLDGQMTAKPMKKTVSVRYWPMAAALALLLLPAIYYLVKDYSKPDAHPLAPGRANDFASSSTINTTLRPNMVATKVPVPHRPKKHLKKMGENDDNRDACRDAGLATEAKGPEEKNGCNYGLDATPEITKGAMASASGESGVTY